MLTQVPAGLGPRYRAWVVASTLSESVDDAAYFALAWAAAGFGGPAAGLVMAAITGPRVALTLVGGAVTDRVGPRGVVVGSLATLVVAAALTAGLTGILGTPLALLVGFALVIGVATAFLFPSTNAMVARAVAPADLARALSLRQVGYQVASLAGRPLGGLLVGLGGLALVLWTNAATFLVAIGAVLLLRLPRHEPAPRTGSMAADIGSGLRTAWREPGLRTVLCLYAVAAGAALPVGSLLVPLLATTHGWTATTAGLVAGAAGLGATATALVVARTGAHPRTAAAVAVGLAACAAGALVLAATPITALAMAGAALHGAGLAVFIAHGGPVVVTHTPSSHLARLQAVLGVVQSVAMFLLSPLLGVVAGIDPRLAVVLAVVLLLTAAVAAARSRNLGGRSGPRGDETRPSRQCLA